MSWDKVRVGFRSPRINGKGLKAGDHSGLDTGGRLKDRF